MNDQTIAGGMSRPLSRTTLAVSMSIVVTISTVVVASVVRAGDSGLASLMTPEAGAKPDPGVRNLMMNYPGVVEPRTIPAEEVRWDDDEEVIGVTVAGVSRAYLVSALEHPSRHIVNDMVGGVPVTVTYCNIARCFRGFTSDQRDKPLDLGVGGLYQGEEMMLLIGGERFLQKTLEPFDQKARSRGFPYKDFPLTVTTWKKWKEAHPETIASTPTHPAG